ncbi:uncharacterized protein ANIA_11356 [Aspergillus nidulans FGSC A4]|uniref:Uncharacterized protein n=1 Tax=Emericella nidulans (strain FGSC A4 / ATCC 38163 / CBS 112.46 / NRRL 194 / M139) TaxID=227321 RepID=C8VHH7_EMENI|nr:hypothetical protein [Aspergillus nidulans FGSC A4]CBF84328.1 TPA: hypothetical protein ANIA_11356 [Aspergillus nidulans FGSC A4]
MTYKGLFSEQDAHQPVAIKDKHEAVQQQIISNLQAQSKSDLSAALPSLPRKKDGTVYISNMRKKIKELGYIIPCNKYPSAKDCCKDQNTSLRPAAVP